MLLLEKEPSYKLTCIVEVPEMYAEYKYIYFVLKYVNILSHFLYAQTWSWCYCDSPLDTYVIIMQCVTPSALWVHTDTPPSVIIYLCVRWQQRRPNLPVTLVRLLSDRREKPGPPLQRKALKKKSLFSCHASIMGELRPAGQQSKGIEEWARW